MAFLSSITSKESSWRNHLFVTTDIDWACDEVIEHCYDFFASLGVDVTWFATHETSWNDKISKHERFEIGSHPNFNHILFGKDVSKTPEDVIKDNLRYLPKTNLIRSHSTTNSSPLLELFRKNELTIESNLFVPYNSGVVVKPFMYFNGILRVPYIWSDDVHMAYGWEYKEAINGILSYEGIKVIDCHPIHIFLNSEKIERYNDARPNLKNIAELRKVVNKDHYGIRDFIKDLITQYNERSNNR